MDVTWEQIHLTLAGDAQDDLRRHAGAGDDAAGTRALRPVLVAFRDEDPLLWAWFRPMLPGDVQSPLIEVVTLAAGLRANRAAFGGLARAWSLNDPLPPVIDGLGDLRQKVFAVHLVDASGRRRMVRSLLWLVRDGYLDGPVLDEAGGEHGLVARVLTAAFAGSGLASDRDAVVAQLVRCQLLGHTLGLAPRVPRDLIDDSTAIIERVMGRLAQAR